MEPTPQPLPDSSAAGFEPTERTTATQTAPVARRPDLRPVPSSPRPGRSRRRRRRHRRQRGSCPPAAGLASRLGRAPPAPLPPPRPHVRRVCLFSCHGNARGAAGGRGEEREGRGLAAGRGTQRVGGGGRAGAEKLSKERAAAAGSSPARESERGCGRAGSRGGGGRRRHREPPSAPPRPSGPPPTHPPAASAHGRARPAQPPGLRAPRRRPVRRSAPPRPVSPGGAARPPTRPQPQRPRRQPRRPRQWWRTLLSRRERSSATGPTYSPC